MSMKKFIWNQIKLVNCSRAKISIRFIFFLECRIVFSDRRKGLLKRNSRNFTVFYHNIYKYSITVTLKNFHFKKVGAYYCVFQTNYFYKFDFTPKKKKCKLSKDLIYT